MGLQQQISAVRKELQAEFEAGVYQITPLIAYLLGFIPDLAKYRKNREAILTYRDIANGVVRVQSSEREDIKAVFKIRAMLKYFDLLDRNIISEAIQQAYIHNTLYVQDLYNEILNQQIFASRFTSLEKMQNDSVLLSNKSFTLEEKKTIKSKNILVLPHAALAEELFLHTDIETWQQYFREVALEVLDNDQVLLCSMGAAYLFNAKTLSFVEPEYRARQEYFIQSTSSCVVESHNGWGNFLVYLLRAGMSKNLMGVTMRVTATNAVVPVVNYGNKSSMNVISEDYKVGVLHQKVEPNSYGLKIQLVNSSNSQAIAAAFEELNAENIVSIPQHQGEYLKTGIAAYASKVSLITLNIEDKPVQVYLFNRSVDKTKKVLNRCSLLNRTGTFIDVHSKENSSTLFLSKAKDDEFVNDLSITMTRSSHSIKCTHLLEGDLANWELFGDYYTAPSRKKKSLTQPMVTLKKFLEGVKQCYNEKSNSIEVNRFNFPAAAFTATELENNLGNIITNYKQVGVPKTFGLMSCLLFLALLLKNSDSLKAKLTIPTSKVFQATLAITSLGVYEGGPLGGMDEVCLDFISNFQYFCRTGKYEGDYEDMYAEWLVAFGGNFNATDNPETNCQSFDVFRLIWFAWSLMDIASLTEQKSLDEYKAPSLCTFIFDHFSVEDCRQLAYCILLLRRVAQGGGTHVADEDADLAALCNFISDKWLEDNFQGNSFIEVVLREAVAWSSDLVLHKTKVTRDEEDAADFFE